ncbi:MAG: tagaturonate reductase [Edaphocola sp.]
MQLNAQVLNDIKTTAPLRLPAPGFNQLPEKILQFGTGVLLRGLPEYFIDKANSEGVFGGRIVVVKSTDRGSGDAFDKQDNLYTICIRGIDQGKEINRFVINSSISRVLAAGDSWQSILACAHNPDLQIIISNTTEVGIVLEEEDDLWGTDAPHSFPGKLVAFLLERYKHFKGSSEAAMVILPTELVSNNGELLKKICLQLAAINELDPGFCAWLQHECDFCNTLVDCIVPGALPAADAAATQHELGYQDELMIMSEVYRLWAIETSSERTKKTLGFAATDKGLVITPDINKFKNLKLRLLNGAHTFTCAYALLHGFDTVKKAMQDESFSSFIGTLMHEEIVPTLVGNEISGEEAHTFANAVLDRFRNPFLEHRWASISLNYTSKMHMRNVATITTFCQRNPDSVPQKMAEGFAAYLAFMNTKNAGDRYISITPAGEVVLDDADASTLYQYWQSKDTKAVVHGILSDRELWGDDLALLKGFEEAVCGYVEKFVQG